LTKVSCRAFKDNQRHLELFALAWRLPAAVGVNGEIDDWLLTTLRGTLVDWGEGHAGCGVQTFQLAEVTGP
jgi:hypothetical protein